MLLKLPLHTPWLVILVPLFAGPLVAQVAQSPPNAAPALSQTGLVVLHNGEVLNGHVVREGERLLVRLPGREISLRPGEIDVVARTMEEAYELKRAKVPPTDISGRLDLATWCLRHNLLANAGNELAAAAQVQPFEPRLKALQRRLEKAIEGQALAARASYHQVAPSAAPTAAKLSTGPGSKSNTEVKPSDEGRVWPPIAASQPPIVKPVSKPTGVRQPNKADAVGAESSAALERFVRSLPARAVEEFTSSVHPTITRSCATAGCHAPDNQTEFTLLRLPQNRTASRRLTQRNLYNTVQLVDFSKPKESRLLKVASQPHGPLKAGVFGDQRSPKYRELAGWVSGLTGVTINRDDAATSDKPAAIAWENLHHSTSEATTAEQAKLDAILDQLEPNRPAEIKQATERAPTKKTAKARPDARANIKVKDFRK